MTRRTPELKRLLTQSNDLFEKLGMLEGAFKGETAYILATGPSLARFDPIQLKSFLSGKLVLSIKQAYQFLDNETDFHILHHSSSLQRPAIPLRQPQPDHYQ